MKTIILGLDCATNPTKTGLALATWNGQRTQVLRIGVGTPDEPIVQTLLRWLPAEQPALLAIDAPLGWPAAFGRNLAQHQAGETIENAAETLFRRQTDQFVKQLVGRQPLDVGADRIARTAHAALRLLGELRRLTGQPIPLAWSPSIQGIAAIEVYPAGTLTACGLPASGYKKSGQTDTRSEILTGLRQHLTLDEDVSLPLADADALDALVCVLAGADFLSGKSLPPPEPERARKEGWIWIRRSLQ